ncbi:tetratricopeptide repeat (TPR)-like superfamily protein [Tasmannia lanceolata]|uniref:tetratricopeptide repeat (TPR)-like superfamily protein n=1 Tax=Tasmannia lanceolata TaxID=3420 RepID=UPI004064C3A5
MIICTKNTIGRKFSPYLTFAQNLHLSFAQTNYHTSQNSISLYSNLITHCLSLNSLISAQSIHAQLIKVGFNHHTFLGNRLVELYSKVGTIKDAFQAFDEIPNKNVISWNILVMGFFKIGSFVNARQLFDEMPERDVVSWNSMISGYALNGFSECALEVFSEMNEVGMRANGFTFSIIVSCVSSAYHGKQIHGNILRNAMNSSNLVVGNSLIDMYGKLMLIDYAFGVFLTMEELDVVSWNSMIWACNKCSYRKWALDHFWSMRNAGFSPDDFTVSTVITVCANLRDLEKGKHVFAQCIRMGFLSNSIVSGAIIDMFSKCNRLEDSIQLFEEMPIWDLVLCNCMIAGYARHGFPAEALQLFVLTLRENFRPTEFTLATVLSSTSFLLLAELGTQIHSLVLKLGSDLDHIVASSLVDMYAKSGLIDYASEIFSKMGIRDLVSWNTMIMGFAQNGRGLEALRVFEELCKSGPPPDRITLGGVLLACGQGGLINEAWSVFSSMEEKYGVTRGIEHYTYMVDMLGRAGKLTEAMEMIETMPHEPSPLIWEVLLGACRIHGSVKFAQMVAERLMELEPRSSLAYLVLAQIYATKGRWESVARVRKDMKERGVNKAIGCSWIGIKNHIFDFKANQILHCGGEAMFSLLRLMVWEMRNEGYVSQQYTVDGDGGEE